MRSLSRTGKQVTPAYRLLLVLLLVACSSTPAPAPPPDPYNLGFEQLDAAAPKGWISKTHKLVTDARDKHGGARSLVIDGQGVALVSLDATSYRTKRVTLRGWIKTADSEGTALWLRADAGEEMVGLDNMSDNAVRGTTAWQEVSVVVDVPASATQLVFGALQMGNGTGWFDDLALDVGGTLGGKIVLEGVVSDPAGAPAAGAEVSLVAPAGEIAQHVSADERGHFKLEAVAGTWGVSAQRPGAVGAFLAQQPYAKSVADLKIALVKDGGVTVRGKLSKPTKPGAFVQIAPYSMNDADLFAVPVKDDGTFEALVPKSDEYLLALLGTAVRANVKRTGPATLDVVLDMSIADPPPAEVVAHIAKHGVPLVSVEAGNGFDDMASLAKLIGNAKIVALGESTHGSREIFQMKHRFLEYLVTKHGFTVFAIEANQPECRAVNDYVLHGKGTAKAALAGLYFWTWNTEEVLAMIEWMRAWNADPGHTNKVQFTGFDMQTTKVAYQTVKAFVEKTAPDQAKGLLAPVAVLAETTAAQDIGKLGEPERKALREGLTALGPILAKADADTRHDLRILEQATVMYMEHESFVPRDRAMAENVGWLVDQTKARVVVWAHNGHISNTLQAFENMGSHLRAKYKADYLNLGFLFGEGSFQAIDVNAPSPLLGEHTLGPPPESNASVAFARTGKPLLVLDLRTLPTSGAVADWFAKPHPVRETGADWRSEAAMTVPHVLPALFDGIIYIDKTTRARPVKE